MCIHADDEAERLALAAEVSRKVAILEAYFRGLEYADEWPDDHELAGMALLNQWVAYAVRTGQNPEDVIGALAGYLEATDTSAVTYPALMAGMTTPN